jgi:hypothetical protein
MPPWSASGRRGAVADDARAQEVEPCHSSEEAGEQSRAEAVAAAESVERRAGAKGNADQQSTHRAQNWVRVSQALDRNGKRLPFGPEVGTVCGKAASTGLCGGREATRVPTATKAPAKAGAVQPVKVRLG